MAKKSKIISVALASREAMESTVADIVRLKLQHARLTAAMEEEIAAVRKRHQEAVVEICRDLESKEASVRVYCEKHRAELFRHRKSLDLLLAEVGFECTPHRVEKRAGRSSWPAIARRLLGLDWAAEKYVRAPAPEVDKQALLRDRHTLTPERLAEAGLKFAQDENFFIRPRSELAEMKEAA
jgi:phage host-nuclease inhibitor protein Gam